MVELTGIEPVASSLRTRLSPNSNGAYTATYKPVWSELGPNNHRLADVRHIKSRTHKGARSPFGIVSTQSFLCAFRHFAQRAVCPARMRAIAATDSLRFLMVLPTLRAPRALPIWLS